jgi:hypothetical protein
VGFKDDESNEIQNIIHYGELHLVLDCFLDDQEMWGEMKSKRHLLAVITPCKTDGKDATKVVTEYTKLYKPIVTDLQAVQCVIGRAQRRGKTWGIIDRSMDETRPEFISKVEGTRQVTEEASEDEDDSD